jgi:hypothetical protein
MTIDLVFFLISCAGVTLMSVFVAIMEIMAGSAVGETWRRTDRLEVYLEMIVRHMGIDDDQENH